MTMLQDGIMKQKNKGMKLFLKNLYKTLEQRLKYRYYSSIDFLILFNFFKVIETNDYRYLLKLKDYELLPEISEKLNDKLQLTWLEIQNQYSTADDSNYQIINFAQSKGLQKMQIEYLMYWNIYNMMVIAPEHKETIRMIKYAKLEKETVKSIEKKLKGLKNRILLKCKDLEQKDDKPVDYLQIIDEIEDIKGRSIDVFKTTVRQYIAIRKNIKHGKRQNNTKGHNRQVSQ